MTDSAETPATGRLILVLGDQLSPAAAALRDGDPARDRVLMAEVMGEATYVRHHKKKIAFVFSAMRHFAAELAAAGWAVDYVPLDDPDSTGTLAGEVARALDRHPCDRVVVTEPGEWRVLADLAALRNRLPVPLDLWEDDRFLCPRADFAHWAAGRRQMRMEHFYQDMRRRTGLLMDGAAPAGGRWNYDSENRKPPRAGVSAPGPARFPVDATTRAVLDLVAARFPDHVGDLEPFRFGVTRAQAEEAFDHFVETGLARFGAYQDAMVRDEPFLFHAVIAQYLNVGLLDPMAVCRRVEAAWRAGAVPLNAAEGFIRQIIGWREYVRGIYWLTMPGYIERNHLGHTAPLPAFYWTGETDMACLRACITQTLREAYAHHIQRLMVTGNFAMLAGVDPKAVHDWYLAVYADAYEWVELPNTLGMSQFADGGLLGSKPYAAGGNYINRMSDYCSGCRYKVKDKTGPDACPFNVLYWDFLARHRDALGRNPRLGPVYRTWDRMDEDHRQAVRRDAGVFLERLHGPKRC
ncbi:cryptochrome/photolyase family protein [Roseospira navarrensis]|uniref:Cryptochrome/photolyase family protein n=1 Tax=Roseospira navarrensis TaxID=140058 RepID=A0A7X1ZE90_9PROT|nr:cryptochrome/photolyase family protein [Roseospira navarrensis]MQX35807.1 cryptochrome/photolyase family protein [Roseospira navarrensis]